ncbi:hypothetical protein [Actinomadura algeriensis]|uniref:Uncharacterized protein n=1 Tax=Actinomadura algeriensis TaxID=1679523 RepID=A0ABR9K2I3_9ACTN|nr:hypothetical protein [Actinomadura algeriensis]MBE1537032.1 hypothetical protein [Actinomadura algeriensis]
MRDHLESHAFTQARQYGADAEDGVALALGVADEVRRRTTADRDPAV